MATQTLQKWNVIFLVYAELASTNDDLEIITKINKNQLSFNNNEPPPLPIETEVQYLFNDILDAEKSSQADVFVIYNRVDIRQQKDWTSLYQLKNNAGTQVLQRVRKENDQNIQKPEVIVRLFKEIELISPAEHKLLYTWDHGSIFGIFKPKAGFLDDVNSGQYQVIEKKEETIILKGNKPYKREWDKVNGSRAPFVADACNTISTVQQGELVNEILTNEELAEAISLGFNSGKVDILVMMNCCMMNVNTAYALFRQNAARYFIAPQSEINFPTFNYRQILIEIYKRPGIEPLLLAKYIIQTLWINRQPRDYDYMLLNMGFWAILCIDLSVYGRMVFLIKDLIKELTALLNPGTKMKIKDNLELCYRFDSLRLNLSSYMVDLRTFIFFSKDLSPGLYQLHCDFEAQLDMLIVDSFVGDNLFPLNGTASEFKNNLKPSGISVFFPREKQNIIAFVFQSFIAENSPSRSAFFTDTNWLIMVCKYLSL
jgi:hypothetical protein